MKNTNQKEKTKNFLKSLGLEEFTKQIQALPPFGQKVFITLMEEEIKANPKIRTDLMQANDTRFKVLTAMLNEPDESIAKYHQIMEQRQE